MRKLALFLSPLCLGIASGIAFVVACHGTSQSSAQTASGHSVVDSTGAVLGALLGTGPVFASTYDANGTATPVLPFARGQVHTFLDASSHVWNVGGNGDLFQPIASVFYTSADCTGSGYVEQGDPKVVLKHAGTYWTRPAGAASTLTPHSYYPAGSPAGTCEPYPPPSSTVTSIGAFLVSSLVAQAAPTFTPPITVN